MKNPFFLALHAASDRLLKPAAHQRRALAERRAAARAVYLAGDQVIPGPDALTAVDKPALPATLDGTDSAYDPRTGSMLPTPRLRWGVAIIPSKTRPMHANRLAYLHMGVTPPRTIKHRDGNQMNLAWANICPERSIARQGAAVEPSITLRTGKRGWTYIVNVWPSGWKKTVYLGTFKTMEEARDVRDAALARWKLAMHPVNREVWTPRLQSEVRTILQGRK